METSLHVGQQLQLLECPFTVLKQQLVLRQYNNITSEVKHITMPTSQNVTLFQPFSTFSLKISVGCELQGKL